MRISRLLFFNNRYATLRKEGKLGGEAYEYLIAKLDSYKALLDKYAVTQDEVERAKKVAAMCGLEMTNKPDPRR
jgi:hypothetical protein